MNSTGFNSFDKVFVIAEIGNNHEGDFEVAKDLIKAASSAGADAVKFQTIIPENFVSISNKSRINQLKKFQLDPQEIKKLAEYSASKNIIFFSTPFDIQSAIFLNNLQNIFKISSGDNNFIPLINKVFQFNKPTIVSTGLADIKSLKKVYKIWSDFNKKFELAFLHCVSSYPVPDKEANVTAIKHLSEEFSDVKIGYSDHTLGIDACLLAVSLGAKIIEKHFTLDKNFSDFRDHHLSADPKELQLLVKKIRRYETLMGDGIKKIESSEYQLKDVVRRSIASAREIPLGKKIELDDLTWVRPGTGMPIGEEFLLIGNFTNRKISQGELISLDMIN